MKYLLGIDFGGGSSKATLIDINGNIIAESTTEYPTIYGESGVCEQKAENWIDALCRNTAVLFEKSGINNGDVLAVAVDSATHTSLVCDKNFKPLRNAIHWTDIRCREQAARLFKEHGAQIFKKTYHKPDTIWTLPQLVWLYENQREIFKKTAYIFFEKDYIRFFLTGVFCTDNIEAQGSMLFNCNNNAWDSELCSFAHIKESWLPPIVKPAEMVGAVTKSAAEKTGLKEGTQVICGTTDTVMELLASGAVEKGNLTVKLATAGRICVITDRAYPDRHLVNYSHIAEGLWYPGTATKAAASSYRWYRDTFDGNYKELDADAGRIAIGCDGLIFHPYLNGELTPYADPMLCGSFTGVRATHTKAHFTRAVLEGVAYSLLDNKLYLDSLGIDYDRTATLIGGGNKGKLWRKIVSDALGIALKVTESSDSSLGSAMLAGIAMGAFKDAKDAVKKCVKQVDVIYPDAENTEKYQKIFKIYKKIHDALAPIYRERI